jgi:hypothetical protein
MNQGVRVSPSNALERRLSATGFQEIEGNPSSGEAVATFEIFERGRTISRQAMLKQRRGISSTHMPGDGRSNLGFATPRAFCLRGA